MFPSFFGGWASKSCTPSNFWQLVAGLASLVVLCLERESEGPESEKGVVKGSVEMDVDA
jgi:hypothetical protein